jgi:hypothetical protein
MFTVTETNFTNRKPWLFELIDSSGNTCYVMDMGFYKENGMKSPVTMRELDSLAVGDVVKGEIIEISGRRVLTSIQC